MSSAPRASSGSGRSRSSRRTTRGSLHARSADETVAIRSYLDSEEHIRAAKHAGADAIHPGYGFLAESGDFAEAVEAAGLHLDRAAAGCAARRRRQARGEADRRRGRGAGRPGGVPRSRLPADREGGGRRRRPRHARRARRRDELDDALEAARARGEGGVRRRPRAISSATSSGRATSRSSCSPTRTAPCSRSASASAPCSGATRRCSRSRRRLRSTPTCARR